MFKFSLYVKYWGDSLTRVFLSFLTRKSFKIDKQKILIHGRKNINDRMFITIKKRSLILNISTISLEPTCAIGVYMHITSESLAPRKGKQFKILKTVTIISVIITRKRYYRAVF